MSLRDEMISACVPYMRHHQAEEAADAILAKLRPTPLVWGHPSSANFKKGECFHARSDANHYAVHEHLNGWWFNVDSKTYPTLEEAKAAAEAHHIATWREAGGLDT